MKSEAEVQEICENIFKRYAKVRWRDDHYLVEFTDYSCEEPIFWNFAMLEQLSKGLDTRAIDISSGLDWTGCYYPGETPDMKLYLRITF